MRTTLLLLLLCAFPVCAFAADPVYLDQNWTDDDRQWFYTTPQGSKLIPYAWAMALEVPNAERRWVSTLPSFGFLPNRTSSVNPDGLPVGVLRDDQHLGLTCAACHTKQLDYNGVAYQIDGGPTDADLYAFLDSLQDAFAATAKSASNSPKFLRFAKAVLGSNDTPANRMKLYSDIGRFNIYLTQFLKDSTPTTPWGRARTDAFGMIFNRVTAIDLKIPSNNRRPDAPVSYPFLWDTGWHNKVQWNGSAPNSFAIERLARNVGEVLGVFAEIDIKKPTLLHFWYPSTAKRLNLLDIEDRLADLRSPKWPAAFPPLDAALVARGQQLYAQQKCLSCHAIATPGKHQNVVMTPLNVVGTDPRMATVAENRQAKTGVLEGVKSVILFGSRFGETAGAGAITFNAVVGAILSPVELTASNSDAGVTPAPGAEPDHLDADRRRLRQQLLTGPDKNATRDELETSLKAIGAQQANAAATDSNVAYKARPLDGIWATAPYLHNGSVPTLRDLLLPPAQRPKTFHIGSREFDPVNVGQRTDAVPGSFLFDTTLQGNLSSGHTWGTTLGEEDRRALIEYLKSL